jgi:hypothetical protein
VARAHEGLDGSPRQLLDLLAELRRHRLLPGVAAIAHLRPPPSLEQRSLGRRAAATHWHDDQIGVQEGPASRRPLAEVLLIEADERVRDGVAKSPGATSSGSRIAAASPASRLREDLARLSEGIVSWKSIVLASRKTLAKSSWAEKRGKSTQNKVQPLDSTLPRARINSVFGLALAWMARFVGTGQWPVAGQRSGRVLFRFWHSAFLAGKPSSAEEDEMPALNGSVREHVLQEMRQEICELADEGMSAVQIDQSLNGHRTLTEAEQGLIELLTYHAVAEVKGHY